MEKSLFDKNADYIKFEKALQSLAYTQSHWQVFTDFLDFSLLMLKWWDVKPEYFNDLEKKYPKPEQQRLFAEAYTAMAEMAHGFSDPFGNYFMDHFSNDRTGQFFTPEPLCDMMAMIINPEGLEDGKTVCDPSCGSGRFLLSTAKINRKLKFYAADIDLTCVKMTLINFMLQSMPGEVAHMNSLSLEIWKVYKVYLLPHGDHVLPMYLEIQPHQSKFYTPPPQLKTKPEPKPLPVFKETPAGQAVQASLF